VLTDLRAKHAEGKSSWGVNGDTGGLVDMKEYGVWEPEAIKVQSMKTAIEVCFELLQSPTMHADYRQAACLLLRVDDICIAIKAQPGVGTGGGGTDE
jgi:T-complex protein 1 subunit gamma